MAETLITITEAARQLGKPRLSVATAIDVLGLPTERSPLNGSARMINRRTFKTLKQKFANTPARKAAV